MAKIDISWEVLDEVALASLKLHYEAVKQGLHQSERKLLKSLKRVIEYYGGSVE